MNSVYGYYDDEKNVLLRRVTPIYNSGDDYVMTVESIDHEYSKTRYIFNEPYRLVIRKEKGNDVPFWYRAEDEDLRISVMEKSLEEAVRSFHSDIDFLWNFYGKKSDDKLSGGAIKLKNNINKLIREAIKL